MPSEPLATPSTDAPSTDAPSTDAPSRAEPSTVAPPLERWREFLELELDCEVRVVFTRARKTPIRIRPLRTSRARGLEVRMHAFFDAAPPEVQRAVASWIRSGERAPRACRVLDEWIEAGLERLPAQPLRASELESRGAHYDLEQLLDELLAADFRSDAVLHARRPAVTWGRRNGSRSRGSLRLGSYDPDVNRVRLHPVLDQPGVPEWFVRYVVFHECLHAIFPPRRDASGRWIHHGREFRARENAYADYPRVLAWEKRNLRALVRSARSGGPIALPIEKPAAAVSATSAQRDRDARGKAGAAANGAERALRFLQTLLFGD